MSQDPEFAQMQPPSLADLGLIRAGSDEDRELAEQAGFERGVKAERAKRPIDAFARVEESAENVGFHLGYKAARAERDAEVRRHIEQMKEAAAAAGHTIALPYLISLFHLIGEPTDG